MVTIAGQKLTKTHSMSISTYSVTIGFFAAASNWDEPPFPPPASPTPLCEWD